MNSNAINRQFKDYLDSGEYFKELEIRLPNFYLYLKENDFLKYCSGNIITDLSNLRKILLQECDDFEAYDAIEIIKKDLKLMYSNIGCFKVEFDDSVEIKPNFKTRSYEYKFCYPLVKYDSNYSSGNFGFEGYVFNDFIDAIESGIESLGFEDSLDFEIFPFDNNEFKIRAILYLTLENGENYRSKPDDFDMVIIGDDDTCDNGSLWIFKNIPYKSYKNISMELYLEFKE